MGPSPLNPDDADAGVPNVPAPDPESDGGWQGGLTRVTFSRGEHRFEFKCDPGSEALLARVVKDLAGLEGWPLAPGEVLALCQQIEGLAKSQAKSGSSGPARADGENRRKAA